MVLASLPNAKNPHSHTRDTRDRDDNGRIQSRAVLEAHRIHSTIRSQVPILGLLHLKEDEENQRTAQDIDKWKIIKVKAAKRLGSTFTEHSKPTD